MSVRFKFRSSVGFDSVDLAGRPSISVRDLRARIMEQKNLQICRDFDLVISDADKGEAYEDEEFLVPEGSCVVIKRVPAASGVTGALGNDAATKQSDLLDTLVSSPSENVAMENFDDFGNDFYPAPNATLPESDSDGSSMNCISSRKADEVPRCSELPILRCQNFDQSNLSEATSRGKPEVNSGMNCHVKEDMAQTKITHKTEEHKLDGTIDAFSPATLNAVLPTELKCSLCNTIFKEAVMIPCCQHSFCDKCIRFTLAGKACCPRCSSTKCGVEDLLPNLSLRQAIEHFLESERPLSVSDKVLPRYVPDGESGIHAKEVSCAISIRQHHPTLPESPSATGKGSNQVIAESACESLVKNKGVTSHIIHLNANMPLKSTSSLHRGTKLEEEEENGQPEDMKYMTGPQRGGNSSKLPQVLPSKEEAKLATRKKKGFCSNTADATATVMPPSRLRKGDRCCYMCGSPDHLVRDCPAASSPYPMFQTGDTAFHGGMQAYGPSYWYGASIPHVRPHANIYGPPGMMPFDPIILPVTPFGIPSYIPSLYAGLPVSPGLMRMGGVAPPMASGAERPLSRSELLELQDREWKHKSLNEHLEREQIVDDHAGDLAEDYMYHGSRRRSHDYRAHLDKDAGRSSTDDRGGDLVEDYMYHDSRRRSLDRRTHLDKDVGRSSGDESPQSHKRHKHEDRIYDSSHQRPGYTSDDEEIHSVDGKHYKGSHLSVSGRDRRGYYPGKSNFDTQDVSDSSSQYGKERNKHRHKSSSKKRSEKGGHFSSECSKESHHRSRREMSDGREKDAADHKKHGRKRHHHHHHHPDSTSIPDLSSDQEQLLKERESGQSSRHFKHKIKPSGDQLKDDRWEMVDGLDETYKAEHHHHKHKRTH